MRSTGFWRASSIIRLRAAAWAAAMLLALAGASPAQRFDGVNIVAAPGHPFGGASAQRALAAVKRLGATSVAIIPFLWQPSPASPAVDRGSDMSDNMLRSAIRDAHALGLSAIVKPHVWVPESWAGAIEPKSEADWRAWFAAYRGAIAPLTRVAAEEKAEAFVIGTELAKTTQRGEWIELIAALRAAFPGTLLYVAHNAEEADAVPFWDRLDLVGVSLYPPLGEDRDRAARRAAMAAAGGRLEALAARTGKSVLVGEIGLRSARGAAARPWESAEERAAEPDPVLQAEVLADWLAALDRPAIGGVLVWRWFTDPAAGGPADTDFTVQGKPAEGVLLCNWTAACGRR